MRDILFMGEILASVTHEMQNVMAIIKESGALTEDVLALNGSPQLQHGDKLSAALDNIKEQVLRGRNLMLMLNGFAHAAADFAEACDLSRFAGQISVLAERMVRLRECALERAIPETPLPVRGNALLLMQALYLALAETLHHCDKDDRIVLNCTPRDFYTAAGIVAAGKEKVILPGAELAALMAQLNGNVVGVPGGLELRFAPLAPEEGGR